MADSLLLIIDCREFVEVNAVWREDDIQKESVNAHHNRNAEQITGHAPFHQTKRIQIQSEPQADIGKLLTNT